ncbi:hypothetical protein [Lactococcus protaetiae]|uniref:LXG domain-containing protein n=1 Tax=Lactococcus protaetiae TaxID=2592653 RepID=A0A514ZAJ8_9LACT|nr:hypothetical protein [Lactococcus protaetiae]QDK71577.1 hypothetical protein FLP15_10895 [Lactococcus protaetiae]
MGLKYTKADGQALVSALDHNLSTADQIISDLQEGVERLVSCIGAPFAGLSGQAYHAADTLFRQLVVPMLNELKNATTTIKSELNTYKSAIEAFDRYSDSVYDKTYFEHLLEIKRQQKALTENQLTVFSQLLATSLSQTATENLFFEGKGLESVLNHYEKEIQELEDKIHILEDVESRTSSLFSDSLQDFRYALLGAKSLRRGSFDSKGNFTVSKNIDMAWYKKLTGKDLDESLVSKKHNDLTLEDILTDNVSKENQATVEQLKKLAKVTGMTLAEVFAIYAQNQKEKISDAGQGVKNVWNFITGEFSKLHTENKVSADDVIKTIIYYTNQGNLEVVYDETKNVVLSVNGEASWIILLVLMVLVGLLKRQKELNMLEFGRERLQNTNKNKVIHLAMLILLKVDWTV